MRHVIIGTAGHVDHGKTCLIKAITGIDTDRLDEEKKRGITIETGYAWMDFGEGQRVGIVDVPGHEKFIKNMLCGACGVDVALLVVSAKEGIKEQTVEHLDILSLLGVEKGVIAVTKSDLVTPERITGVMEQVRSLVKGTFLDKAAVLPVSINTGEGIDRLKRELAVLCRSFPELPCGIKKSYRLPLDRVFTLKGAGTIATGTLNDGALDAGSWGVLYPSGLKVRIRGIQVYGKNVSQALPGQRTAVQLTGVDSSKICRGDVLALAGTLEPVSYVDVKINMSAFGNHRLNNGEQVHVYHGTRKLLGKIIFFGTDQLETGQWAYAQLCLQEEAVFRKGDRMILRQDSIMETTGGALVLDPVPKKHRRSQKGILDGFRVKDKGTAMEQMELALLENKGRFLSVRQLAHRYLYREEELPEALELLVQNKTAVLLKAETYIHMQEYRSFQARVQEILREYRKNHPLEKGMPKSELIVQLCGKNPYILGNELLQKMERQGLIGMECHLVWLKEKKDTKESAAADRIYRKIGDEFERLGAAPPAFSVYQKELDSKEKRDAFYALLRDGELILLNDSCCIHRTALVRAKERFGVLAEESGTVALSAFKENMGCSRKIAIAILEYFDRIRYTQKRDEGRVLHP